MNQLQPITEALKAIPLIPETSKHRESILFEIHNERERQDKKFGKQTYPPPEWLMILGEEVGETNKAALESRLGQVSPDCYREELIQVAAVAVAMIEDYDRRGGVG